MTFGEAKKLISNSAKGEISLPTDDILIMFFNKAIISEIASTAYPMNLVESDRAKAEMLFALPTNDVFFIRKPKQILNDSSIIDLDEDLCFALCDFVSSYLVKNLDIKAVLLKQARAACNEYSFRAYEYIEQKTLENRCLHD